LIGLAGNIVQFADFGIKLVSKSAELYRSADGALRETVELDNIVTNLRELTQKLIPLPQPLGAHSPGSQKQTISDMAANCVVVANELLHAIESLGLSGGNHRRWESVKRSMQTTLTRGKVQDIEQILNRLR
jgi:hypothetical protein